VASADRNRRSTGAHKRTHRRNTQAGTDTNTF